MIHHAQSHQSHGRKRVYKLIFVGLVVIAALILGCIGFLEHAREHHEHASFPSALYHTIQLFVLHSPHFPCEINKKLEVARYLAAIVAFYAVLETLSTIFYEQIQLLWLRFLLCFKKNSLTVICGLGRKGLQLVKSCRTNGDKIVVIEKDGNNDFVRVCREMGIIVLVGDATDKKLLKKAGIHKARYLVATSGKDGTNVEIAVNTYQKIKKKRDAHTVCLDCRVHIVDSGLRTAFKQHRVFAENLERFTISMFDVYENSARLLFKEHRLDHVSISVSDPRSVHLIIVGFGQMGDAVLLQAVRMGHFSNRKKLRATVVDREANRRKKNFYHRHPQFEQVCDAEFLEMEAEDRQTVNTLEGLCKDQNSIATLAVCFDDDARNLSFALSMLSVVKECKTPIRVRMAEGDGLSTLLDKGEEGFSIPGDVHIFGTTAHTCTWEMVISDELDNLAKVIHNDYVEEMRKNNKKPEEKPAMRPWEYLDEDYIDSNRQQADHIPVKLRAIGCYSGKEQVGAQPVTEFKDEEVKLMAEMEHRRWYAERIMTGWKPGDKNDPMKKTNPDLKEWNELDDGTKEYNYKTVRNIPRFLDMIGEKIYRK